MRYYDNSVEKPDIWMKRLEIRIKGIVQGVGFRPFIYTLANRYSLKGFVLNDNEGVKIEIEGEDFLIEKFLKNLQDEAPPLSKIEKIIIQELPLVNYTDFTIKPSAGKTEKFVLISPDIATCEECLKELFDPQDRRYRYPFINCTNCGPRFTIIMDIPYDRERTTMKDFTMCERCRAEYEDPSSRRFHAQPNCCPQCGPHLEIMDHTGNIIKADDPIQKICEFLHEGKIVAIKGLGGFHLACDAQNHQAVSTLRKRKGREEKPFAVMAKDIDTVKSFCRLNEVEEKLLLSEKRPIVLLRKKDPDPLAPGVAPNQRYHGVMLPYTPLHHLILQESGLILVMTSGNLCEEPICFKNEEALSRLGGIADYFLMHNRDIYMRCDDSVSRCFNGKEMILRRSRGYVPDPIKLPFKSDVHILACGAELKNTFCVIREDYAFLSHHIGDLENLETLVAFKKGIEHFKKLFSIDPVVVAHDMHPEYLSTKYARELPIKQVPVQHHHAHIVSCMVDNGITGKVIGVAFDGLGYGSDGKLWGGEFLVADFANFKRVAHFKYIPMPGGVKAIVEPWRMAFSYLYDIYGDQIFDLGIDFVREIDRGLCNALLALIKKGINSPLTSSAGRLFDGVSALLGIRRNISYEGQAAIELEMLAEEGYTGRYNYELENQNSKIIINPAKIFQGIINDLNQKVKTSVISAKFHNTIAEIICEVVLKIASEYGLKRVVLSGGVFQNMVLLKTAVDKLHEMNFEVYTHNRVPPNDGGISLGQAVIAAQLMKTGNEL